MYMDGLLLERRDQTLREATANRHRLFIQSLLPTLKPDALEETVKLLFVVLLSLFHFNKPTKQANTLDRRVIAPV